jgi:hypothetical protein
VQQENGVLVSSLQELFSGISEEENVAIVKRVSDLEGIDGISASLLDFLVNLLWGHSVVVKAVVELDLGHKSCS